MRHGLLQLATGGVQRGTRGGRARQQHVGLSSVRLHSGHHLGQVGNGARALGLVLGKADLATQSLHQQQTQHSQGHQQHHSQHTQFGGQAQAAHQPDAGRQKFE
jgi:hypothetical protein